MGTVFQRISEQTTTKKIEAEVKRKKKSWQLSDPSKIEKSQDRTASTKLIIRQISKAMDLCLRQEQAGF